MDLNEECENRFRIGHWERWYYDLDTATLSFSDRGVPQVIAEIQVVGSTQKVQNMVVELGQRKPAIMRDDAYSKGS
jgi:hypothetical protein